MKQVSLIVLIFLTFSSLKCQKEECHYGIRILNNSDSEIIYSTKGTLGVDPTKCSLSKNAIIQSNESFEQRLIDCWEHELKFRDFEFYIVDPSMFNEGGFYDCDSIEHKNAILKHFVLTYNDLEVLRANNFTVTYP